MSNVLKASEAAGQASRFKRFSFQDVQAEAREITARARTEAEQIVAAARGEAGALREQARAEGFAAGETRGLAEGREAGHAEALAAAKAAFEQSQAMLVSALSTALDNADREKRKLLAAAHNDLIGLALAVAERVVKCVGRLDRDAAVANASEAIDLAGRRSDMVLEVHPEDHDAVKRFAETLLTGDEERRHVRVVSEEEISPGGCRFRSAEGSVDATLETQIERIVRHLLPGSEEGA